MPNPSLDALRPTLLAIPLEDVKVPHIPPKVTHQEAEALLIFVQKPDHLPLFDRLGLSPQVASATLALQASREAQSLWTTARDANKPEAQKAREDDGYTLRAEILAACDWNLRADEAALRVRLPRSMRCPDRLTWVRCSNLWRLRRQLSPVATLPRVAEALAAFEALP